MVLCSHDCEKIENPKNPLTNTVPNVDKDKKCKEKVTFMHFVCQCAFFCVTLQRY
jgi:hypothetical protein